MSPYIAFYGDERLGGPASSPHSSSSSFHGSDVLKCHETRFALVFGLALLCCRQIPSSPFRLLIKIEIQYCWIASLLVGKLLDSIFIFFFFFCLFFLLWSGLVRLRSSSVEEENIIACVVAVDSRLVFYFLVIPFTAVKKWKRRKEISVECARKIKAQAENDDKTQALRPRASSAHQLCAR